MARTLTVRLPEAEAEILAAYAEKTKRTRSELIRAFVRSLAEPKRKKGSRR
jgi:metal-responsive CopG/Arc/MetJ family transcriptional regulator